MWNDIVNQTVKFNHLPYTYTIDHNDVINWQGITDPTGTNGNISVSPGFRPNDPLYHITRLSPCRDAGRPRSPSGYDMFVTFPGMVPYIQGAEDCDLNTRSDLRPDIGWDEYLWPDSPGDVKTYGMLGSSVFFADVAVTSIDTAINSIYVETFDRLTGIRVKTADPSSFVVNQVVEVKGTVQVDNPTGEMYIQADAGYPKYIKEDYTIRPLGIPSKAQGGGTRGLQAGVESESGINTMGLLATVWGKVTKTDSDYFYMDDGSGLNDSSGYLGVKVIYPDAGSLTVGQFVYGTGIISCYKDTNGKIRRLIR
jgi:hypothetical protein